MTADAKEWQKEFKPFSTSDKTKNTGAGTILAVDDQPHNLLLLERMLEQMGYHVMTARSGQGALALLERSHDKIQAVLMDIQMVEMDGIETTRRLRDLEKENALSPVPVIAVTANAQPQVEKACYAAGMNDYILKPFRMEQLMQVLQILKKDDGKDEGA
mgnify:CR=1 FL=1